MDNRSIGQLKSCNWTPIPENDYTNHKNKKEKKTINRKPQTRWEFLSFCIAGILNNFPGALKYLVGIFSFLFFFSFIFKFPILLFFCICILHLNRIRARVVLRGNRFSFDRMVAENVIEYVRHCSFNFIFYFCIVSLRYSLNLNNSYIYVILWLSYNVNIVDNILAPFNNSKCTHS